MSSLTIENGLPANIGSSFTDGSLASYIKEISKFPMLSAEEEVDLADKFKNGDVAAAQKLVTSHLRLVVKMAFSFRHYGLPLTDLISEGNLGLMQAVKKFEPSKGFRLATYAMWWIKATIQEYIMHSWSIVKVGTSSAQKKLFFNLNKIKNKLRKADSEYLSEMDMDTISKQLNVSRQEIVEMDISMGGDSHLNDMINSDSEHDKISSLEDVRPNQIDIYQEIEENTKKSTLLKAALKTLNKRELFVLKERRLKEDPTTLDVLSKSLDISKERVRQIEARAIEKLQKEVAGGV